MWFFIGKNEKNSKNITERSSWMNLNRSESFANAALMPKNSKQWTSTRVYTRPSPVTFSWFKAETFTNLLIVAINHAKKSIDSQLKSGLEPANRGKSDWSRCSFEEFERLFNVIENVLFLQTEFERIEIWKWNDISAGSNMYNCTYYVWWVIKVLK